MTTEEAIARLESLRAEATELKRLIRQNRKKLQVTSASLAALERECRSWGISFVVVSKPEKGTE